jgi:oligopeptide transport system substrate-binding protein
MRIKLLSIFLSVSLFLMVSPLLAQQTEPVTLYMPGNTIVTLDPQLVAETDSLDVDENVFLGLTDIDPKTLQVRPEAATKWQTNETGDVWTFNLRTDIPWVAWNPVNKQAAVLRNVTAEDFVYAIRRGCDPRVNGAYIGLAAQLIKGCEGVAALDPQTVTDADLEQISVEALGDSRLQITTKGIIPYFLSALSMPIFRAVPREIIEFYGDDWTNIGTIVSNGSYLLDEQRPGIQWSFVKNPLYPADVNDTYGGNIERVVIKIGCNACFQGDEYLRGQLDIAPVGGGDVIDMIRANPDLNAQYIQGKRLSVEYLVFNYEKPPFDNVHVRRAFSTVMNREAFTRIFLKGTSLPIDHIAPPGAMGAMPPGSFVIGSATSPGYDPDYARTELAAGGYPNCEGFPPITLFVIESYQGDHIKQSAANELGCDPLLLNVLNVDFGTLMQLSSSSTMPADQRPNAFVFIWGADYPDAYNFLHDVLGCDGMNASRRPCGVLDEQIVAAGQEFDYERRGALFAEIERAMFGIDGEFPVAPIRIPTDPILVKPWLTGFFETDGIFAGKHWNTYHIDQAAQLAGRAVSP